MGVLCVQVVSSPLPGVDRALVIAGSDKRGTIYGIYDVSEQIGVHRGMVGRRSRATQRRTFCEASSCARPPAVNIGASS